MIQVCFVALYCISLVTNIETTTIMITIIIDDVDNDDYAIDDDMDE